MSIYNIPQNIDIELRDTILKSLPTKFRPVSSRGYILDSITNQPIALEFIPDLTIQEQATLDAVFGYALSLNDFESLPNYATWTPQESYDNTFNAIFNGANQATIDAQIDALPNTVAGMKTGLKALATEIIAIRFILATTLKMIIYLRNLVIKIR